MKKLTTAALLLGSMMSASASAALMFDQDVTNNVIMGNGIGNGGFTTDRANGIELGLRGKLRHNASGAPSDTFNSNGDGTYSFVAGVAPTQSAPTGVWSYEWSINSNFDGSNDSTGGVLTDYTYMLSLDTDPSAAISFLTFDPINDINPKFGVVAWDHSIGDNTTAQSAGAEANSVASYATLVGSNNIAQNSQKPHWTLQDFGFTFDPTLDGTYDFELTAFNANGGQAASTSMQIIVGAGATIPEPGTMAILLTGLLGLAARKKFAK